MTIFTEMKKTIGKIKITVQKSAKKKSLINIRPF